MLDTVEPAANDVDVTALFHGGYLQDIQADPQASTVTKEKATLTVRHLYPETMAVKAEKTPSYLNTYREYPLQAEGMLTTTARTAGKPLVIANLLSTDTGGLKTTAGAGHVAGSQAGKDFAFTTSPGASYTAGAVETDALAVTWTADTTFAALCTTLSRDGALLVRSAEPITCERTKGGLKYSLSKAAAVAIGLTTAPGKVLVNGAPARGAKFDKAAKTLTVTLPAGEGTITF